MLVNDCNYGLYRIESMYIKSWLYMICVFFIHSFLSKWFWTLKTWITQLLATIYLFSTFSMGRFPPSRIVSFPVLQRDPVFSWLYNQYKGMCVTNIIWYYITVPLTSLMSCVFFHIQRVSHPEIHWAMNGLKLDQHPGCDPLVTRFRKEQMTLKLGKCQLSTKNLSTLEC